MLYSLSPSGPPPLLLNTDGVYILRVSKLTILAKLIGIKSEGILHAENHIEMR
jgi:hypothetical protein